MTACPFAPQRWTCLEVSRLCALGTQLCNFALRSFEGLFDVVLAGDTALAGRKLMGKDAELNRYSDELQDLLVVLAVVLTLRPGVGLHVAVDAQSGQADQLGQLPLRKPR